MNRVIKFRVWETISKTMLPLGEFTEFDLNKIIRMARTGTLGENVKLMQFTGLKDKNGKDIYEGDIVKATGKKYEGSYNLTVEWYVETCESGWRLSSMGWYKEELEIIGNIYSNPELLKETT